jgi:hypothetical protein
MQTVSSAARNKQINYKSFETPTMALDVTQSNLVGTDQCFGEMYYRQLQDGIGPHWEGDQSGTRTRKGNWSCHRELEWPIRTMTGEHGGKKETITHKWEAFLLHPVLVLHPSVLPLFPLTPTTNLHHFLIHTLSFSL